MYEISTFGYLIRFYALGGGGRDPIGIWGLGLGRGGRASLSGVRARSAEFISLFLDASPDKSPVAVRSDLRSQTSDLRSSPDIALLLHLGLGSHRERLSCPRSGHHINDNSLLALDETRGSVGNKMTVLHFRQLPTGR